MSCIETRLETNREFSILGSCSLRMSFPKLFDMSNATLYDVFNPFFFFFFGIRLRWCRRTVCFLSPTHRHTLDENFKISFQFVLIYMYIVYIQLMKTKIDPLNEILQCSRIRVAPQRERERKQIGIVRRHHLSSIYIVTVLNHCWL